MGYIMDITQKECNVKRIFLYVVIFASFRRAMPKMKLLPFLYSSLYVECFVKRSCILYTFLVSFTHTQARLSFPVHRRKEYWGKGKIYSLVSKRDEEGDEKKKNCVIIYISSTFITYMFTNNTTCYLYVTLKELPLHSICQNNDFIKCWGLFTTCKIQEQECNFLPSNFM